jgi:hypothetical protein
MMEKSFFSIEFVLSFIPRFMDSDYSFGIFKVFLSYKIHSWRNFHFIINFPWNVIMEHLRFVSSGIYKKLHRKLNIEQHKPH